MDETCLWSYAGRVWQFSAGRSWWAALDGPEAWPPGMHAVVRAALAAGARARMDEDSTSSAAAAAASSCGDRGGGLPATLIPTRRVFGRLGGSGGDPFGDRCTELVLIGIGMDQAAIVRTLRACVLTDAEWALGPDAWDAYDDPFDFIVYENAGDSEGGECAARNEEAPHAHGPGCTHGAAGATEEDEEEDARHKIARIIVGRG